MRKHRPLDTLYTLFDTFAQVIQVASYRCLPSGRKAVLPDGRTHQPVRPGALPLGWSWTGSRSPCGRWTICTRRPRGKPASPPRCSVPHPPRSYTLLHGERKGGKVYAIRKKNPKTNKTCSYFCQHDDKVLKQHTNASKNVRNFN